MNLLIDNMPVLLQSDVIDTADILYSKLFMLYILQHKFVYTEALKEFL
jgi:hypothetical protein